MKIISTVTSLNELWMKGLNFMVLPGKLENGTYDFISGESNGESHSGAQYGG